MCYLCINYSSFSFQVPAAKLTKDAFWTKVDEERLASESLMEKLVDKFGTKPVPKSLQGDMNGDGANGGIGGKKKGKELRVLDQKVIKIPIKHKCCTVDPICDLI